MNMKNNGAIMFFCVGNKGMCQFVFVCFAAVWCFAVSGPPVGLMMFTSSDSQQWKRLRLPVCVTVETMII